MSEVGLVACMRWRSAMDISRTSGIVPGVEISVLLGIGQLCFFVFLFFIYFLYIFYSGDLCMRMRMRMRMCVCV